MTKQEEEITKLWQYRKEHIFLVSHDDRTIKNYCKSLSLDFKLIIIMFAVFVGICALFALLFSFAAGSVKEHFSGMFVGWAVFFSVVILLDMIYSYFLFLNYVDSTDSVYIIVAICIAAGIGIQFSPWISLILGIGMFLLSIKIEKNIHYDKQNNLQEMIEEANNGNS